ncbi:hypothetical protein CFIO01_09961 [Colletotrichum fioriniae PJ7]|uniref:Uncharacterized protein n=1 Tax=Colletotrichum fioriniae PJ7 TaxID=1445577 RepID=A0A010S4G8_9PEZI|nr:hypothetical protein CFIO01_09961 [Colletotrichum fioriniae PJ7]
MQQQQFNDQASGSNASDGDVGAYVHGAQEIQQHQAENNAPDGPAADSPGHDNNLHAHDDDIQQSQQLQAQQHHVSAPNSHPGMIPIAQDPSAQNQHQFAPQAHGQPFGQNQHAHQHMPNAVDAGNPAPNPQSVIMAAHAPQQHQQSQSFGQVLHAQQQVYNAVSAAMPAYNLHNVNMVAQAPQHQMPNAVGAGIPGPNVHNAIMAAQAPQPSLHGAANPRPCSKCRKSGNIAWNTRWQDPDAQPLVCKTFATCNHCKWSPRLQFETAVNWVLRNAPWLLNDVGAYCPCYVGDAGNHWPHPMCITRTRAGARAPAALPAAAPAAAPAAVLAAAPPAPPAAPPAALLGAPPAGFVPNPVAPMAQMGPAAGAAHYDLEDGDSELFVMQDEF